MTKTLYSLVAATVIAAAAVTAPTSADARCRGCGVAAGVVGGLAVGAIIGSAIANSPPPPPPAVIYAEPEPVYGPVCHIERHRVWIEGYGYRVRRVQVCD
ncbi:MAG: hypothetical protein GEU91_01275 [Rhizobiales bacterium]|nr:hypothetical protein [Hyphomicrobiales bacterium]